MGTVQSMDSSVFDADLGNIIAIAVGGGSTFVWTSKAGTAETIQCVRGDLARVDDVGVAGYFGDKELSAIMQINDFVLSTDLPLPGDSATLDGESLKIERRSKSDDGIQLTVDMVRA